MTNSYNLKSIRKYIEFMGLPTASVKRWEAMSDAEKAEKLKEWDEYFKKELSFYDMEMVLVRKDQKERELYDEDRVKEILENDPELEEFVRGAK